jgi:hypothetical protein
MRAARRAKATQAPSGDDTLQQHLNGDRHAAEGFRYECGLRCLWILGLRSTADKISVDQGEDCLIKKADGSLVYRQVKKKDDGNPWRFSDEAFGDFITRAYRRFSDNHSVQHEFYTNGTVSRGVFVREHGRKYLNPQSAVSIAGDIGPEFCRTVLLNDLYMQTNPRSLRNEIRGTLEELVERAYRSARAIDLVSGTEWISTANRVLAAEFALLSSRSEVSWEDFDHEIGLDELVRQVRFRSFAGTALVSWTNAVQNPHDYLSPDTAEAVSSPHRIPRPSIEEEALSHVSTWVSEIQSSKPPSFRLLTLVGPHKSGKTWTLMQLGKRSLEQYPDIHVYIAVGSPDDVKEFTYIGATEPTPHLVLIDDLFDGWADLISKPRVFVPDRTLFIATGCSGIDDEELSILRRTLGDQMRNVSLPPTPAEREATDLAMALRRFPPTLLESQQLQATNIWQGSLILRGKRAPGNHLAELRQLLNDRPDYLQLIAPVLFSTVLGLSLPLSLYEKSVRRTVPPDLQFWMVPIERRGQKTLIFEDPADADRLLNEKYGTGDTKTTLAESVYDELLDKCNVSEPQERKFVRYLISRLAKRDVATTARLLKGKSRLIKSVIKTEPLSALAFVWLPTLAALDIPDLFKAAVDSCPSTPPENGAEVSLWIEAYGTGAAIRHLQKRMETLGDMNDVLISRTAEMVRRVPMPHRRHVAKMFSHLFVALPWDTLQGCLMYRDTFPLVTSLIAEHGSAFDREQGLRRIGAIVDDRNRLKIPVPQNWLESFINLADRTFQQERNGASLAISKVLAKRLQFDSPEGAYNDCQAREQSLNLHPLIVVGVKLLEDLAEGPTSDADEFGVPGNLLKLAATWADAEDWEMLVRQHIATLEGIRQVPFNVVSPLVLPSFKAIKRGPNLHIRPFLKALAAWMPSKQVRPGQQTTKLMFRLLAFIAVQESLPDEVRAKAGSSLLHLLTDPGSGRTEGREALDSLSRELGSQLPDIDENLGLVANWTELSPLIKEYLVQAMSLPLTTSERQQLTRDILQAWSLSASRKVRFQLAVTLVWLDEHESAVDLVSELVVTDRYRPNFQALAAIIEARKHGLPAAYNILALISDIYEERDIGVEPWLARRLHGELASLARGVACDLHLVCAELMADRRLRAYRVLFREAR